MQEAAYWEGMLLGDTEPGLILPTRYGRWDIESTNDVNTRFLPLNFVVETIFLYAKPAPMGIG